jgi:hypothetical protein
MASRAALWANNKAEMHRGCREDGFGMMVVMIFGGVFVRYMFYYRARKRGTGTQRFHIGV